ncbi:MAG: discoidin domain-containing protein, partial [Phycisphaerae bacterium]|nr:discoidin domain-containing protein [Phycisphaerae bacterium]
MQAGTWTHVAVTFDFNAGANNRKVYLNGVLDAEGTYSLQMTTNTFDVVLGCDYYNNAFRWGYNGMLDDVRIYNETLPANMIPVIMLGGGLTEGTATTPAPANKATDVLRDAALKWKAGSYAASHDVYWGTVFEDVNTASRTDSKGVLVSQGQTATTYDPAGLLAFGQTYYWRVDEVNAPPDTTIYKGEVWSFTAEPYAYAIRPAGATASSVHEAATGPERTVDRSGLNALDQHGTTGTDMWLSSVLGPTPAWIQYEFEKVIKLHEMWVWNSNQMVETVIGFGAKDVTIEVSVDGATWTALAGVPVFGRGTGKTDYVCNTVLGFGGVLARYVKLTIQSNWGGLSPQCGLSEVRFFQVPTRAFEPSPAVGATNVALDATLSWRSGREAVSHEVYVGADSNTVDAGTVSMKAVAEGQVGLSGFAPEYGRTYYWKVDEVNEAGSLPTWAGTVWSFSTSGYGVVDDFESYDDTCNRVFFSWLGGAPDSGSTEEGCLRPAFSGNGTGSAV